MKKKKVTTFKAIKRFPFYNDGNGLHSVYMYHKEWNEVPPDHIDGKCYDERSETRYIEKEYTNLWGAMIHFSWQQQDWMLAGLNWHEETYCGKPVLRSDKYKDLIKGEYFFTISLASDTIGLYFPDKRYEKIRKNNERSK